METCSLTGDEVFNSTRATFADEVDAEGKKGLEDRYRETCSSIGDAVFNSTRANFADEVNAEGKKGLAPRYRETCSSIGDVVFNSTGANFADEVNAEGKKGLAPRYRETCSSIGDVVFNSTGANFADEVNAEGKKGLAPRYRETCSSIGDVVFNSTGANFEKEVNAEGKKGLGPRYMKTCSLTGDAVFNSTRATFADEVDAEGKKGLGDRCRETCFSIGDVVFISTRANFADEVNAEGKKGLRHRYRETCSSIGEVVFNSTGANFENEVNAEGKKGLGPRYGETCSSIGDVVFNSTGAKYQGKSDWVAIYQDVPKGNDTYRSQRDIKVDDDPQVLDIKEVPAPFLQPSVSSRKEVTEELAFDAPKKIWEIMKDQLSKAVNLEPSVFSPGIYPFGENLLYKNFSYEEVKVVGWKLYPKNYYDLIKVYYHTYKMAIKITDDGERNAKRHAFWQISMMQEFGESFAKEIGDAHERGCPGTAEDNRVDALNNKAALDYARDNPGIDPATAANNMWSTGRLYGYGDKKVAPQHTKGEL